MCNKKPHLTLKPVFKANMLFAGGGKSYSCFDPAFY